MTIEDIQKLAEEFARSGKRWHFHILTPECQLNTTDKYTLVLENVTDKKEYVVYSETPFLDIGKTLITLLHGNDVMKSDSDMKSTPPSEKVKRIVKKAKELMGKGIFWHHHMFFPGCKYNTHGNRWVIVFEDKEKGETIESVSDTEPICDLQHIEGLFYGQKKQKTYIDKLAFIDIKDNKVLSTLSKGKNVWYIPGGKRDGNETDHEAIIREVKEELSVDLIQDTIKHFGTYEAQAHGKQEGTIVRMTCYTAQFIGTLKASMEVAEYRYVDYSWKEKSSPVDKIIFDDLHAKNLIE